MSFGDGPLDRGFLELSLGLPFLTGGLLAFFVLLAF
jgi:hypothetical protein